MKRPWSVRLIVAGALLCAAAPRAADARSAVFGGGPFYSGGTAVMNDLRASGFNTVMLWSIHVNGNGDLVMNDKLVASNGAYVGASTWPGQLATLKQAPTSVNRIELSVGSAGVTDWHSIQALVNAQGTGSGSILYRNFQALINATGADAVNDDDEDLQDVNSTVAFGRMIGTLGRKFTLCPYNNTAFWQNVKSQLGATVDRVYLQVYDGGAGNNPASWNSSLGITVDPGTWSRHGSGCTAGDTPATVQSKMSGWKSSAGIVGGFMWLYDDIQACASQGTSAQYASAINSVLGGAVATPTATPNGTPVPVTSGSVYTLTNQASGKCVDASGSGTANGTAVQQYTCNTTAAQQWIFTSVGSGYYQIATKNAAGQVWDVAGGTTATADGVKVALWGYNGGTNEQWQPVVVSGPYYKLVARHSGKCLDVNGASTADSVQLQQWTCNSSPAQSFSLAKVGTVATATPTRVATATATRTATATVRPGSTATRTATATATRAATATPTTGGGTGQCAGVAAFASCTAYASGAKAVYNNTLYHTIAPIPSNRDCPPNSPFNPSNDNWWVNDGGC